MTLSHAQPAPPVLSRSISTTMLVLYGLGVTIGAGIYVLIGAAAARAGSHAPVAFLIAAAVMGLSAASFAEFASRIPVSAGEAAYVEAGLGLRQLGLATGLLVVAAALISSAAIAQGAAGYIGQVVSLPLGLLTVAVIVASGLVAAWGISQAVWIAAAMTIVEIGGLVVIVMAGLWTDPTIIARAPEAFQGLGTPAVWPGILGATMLAFFAFIGFEAMVNVAEEVESPESSLPLAIGITLVVSTILYILVVWVASHAVSRAELATSSAPLSLVFQRLTGASPTIINWIAILATVNGVIVQTLMAARVIYGMSRQGTLPPALGQVDGRTQTPLVATALATGLTLVSALALPLEALAELTTLAMLLVFALVNAALVALKWRGGGARTHSFSVPLWVPALGTASCLLLLIAELVR